MPDMYDKLGEMLNDVLESGEIPTSRHCEAEGRSNINENQNDQITEEKPQNVSGQSAPAKVEPTHADEEIIDNLIEKFSNDPPKIQFNPEIHDENFNYGKSSCIENPEIISETLALIFAEQGYVGKAIKIYKKLSLHNPEKSCYFADQIKKLKTEKK